MALHTVVSEKKSRVLLITVLTGGLTVDEANSSLDELGRLVHTLGFDVIGRTWQKRPGTGGAFVLGEGKLSELARLTGGPGPSAIGAQIPNAKNPKKKKAFLQDDEEADEDLESVDDVDEAWDDGESRDEESDENSVETSTSASTGESVRKLAAVQEFMSRTGKKRSTRVTRLSTIDDADESGDVAEHGENNATSIEDLEAHHSNENNDVSELTENGERPDVVVFDFELSPSQTRNLERALGVTVMDRTGVIIEIFSRHARTRAARLQVEIAKLKYLAPRIRETGGGSDRQGGGIGAKGAGETAVELDRRRIRDRIKELKNEFESIEKEHDTRRARRSEIRTVALVGYTNAGKSSLMRAMTGSDVYVADKLFATLDTTIRPIHPESRPPVLISDTVGFIKKLPHDLVASFKSTLDEALNAALLLFVVDASDASFRSQLEVTRTVLSEVGVADVPSKLVLNKSDKLSTDNQALLLAEFPEAVMISTRSPEDLARLRDVILAEFEGDMVDEDVIIPYTVQGAIGEIRAQMRVLDEQYDGEGVRLRVRARPGDLTRLRARFGL